MKAADEELSEEDKVDIAAAKISARKVVSFKASKILKSRINK